jgi:hypothetical protein
MTDRLGRLVIDHALCGSALDQRYPLGFVLFGGPEGNVAGVAALDAGGWWQKTNLEPLALVSRLVILAQSPDVSGGGSRRQA